MRFIPKALARTADASRGKPRWQDWAKGLASVAVFLGVAYLVLGWVADWTAEHISEETEVKLFQWLDIGAQPEHSDDFDRAQNIFTELAAESHLRPLPYHLVVLEMGGPNAFALPGGVVGLTPEMLELVQSEMGLAFVLAHELGHQQHRHALKRLGRALVFRLAMGVISGKSDLSLLDHGLSLATLKHSRDQEREADHFGLALVQKIYGTTDGALEFFEEMHDLMGDGSKIGAMFQTHPLTEERIDDLRLQARILAGPTRRL
jgi:Zn-dependent protease with chaperone function